MPASPPKAPRRGRQNFPNGEDFSCQIVNFPLKSVDFRRIWGPNPGTEFASFHRGGRVLNPGTCRTQHSLIRKNRRLAPHLTPAGNQTGDFGPCTATDRATGSSSWTRKADSTTAPTLSITSPSPSPGPAATADPSRASCFTRNGGGERTTSGRRAASPTAPSRRSPPSSS